MRRYGYGSLKQLNTVVDSYAYAKIPLETFVTDSQYMLHDQDFTLGEEFPVSTFQVPGGPMLMTPNCAPIICTCRGLQCPRVRGVGSHAPLHAMRVRHMRQRVAMACQMQTSS